MGAARVEGMRTQKEVIAIKASQALVGA